MSPEPIAYTSIARPTLECSACVWDPNHKKDLNILEMVNRRVARVVYNNKLVFFYQLNTFLKHVENNPYLGLLISKDLKWANHVGKTCKKASSILGFIQHNLRHCPLQCRKSAYIALVRSTLEYGSVVWDPHLQKDIDKLEKVQRKAARFIKRDYHYHFFFFLFQVVGSSKHEYRTNVYV